MMVVLVFGILETLNRKFFFSFIFFIHHLTFHVTCNSGVPAGHFKWHTQSITSVQWHPDDESVLAVSGADDQISIWDLSLENVIFINFFFLFLFFVYALFKK